MISRRERGPPPGKRQQGVQVDNGWNGAGQCGRGEGCGLGHIIKLFFGIFNCAECFFGPFLWYKLKLKMTFCSIIKFCIVKMSL